MKRESIITKHGNRKTWKQLFLVSCFLFLFTLTGIQCTKGGPAPKPVSLQWWRVFDDQSTVAPVIEAYRQVHPNVTIQYRKLRFEEFEQEFLNALAEDRAPDLVSLHSSWLRKYQNKLAPMPATVTLPFIEVKGGLKKEAFTVDKTILSLSPKALQANFVDAVLSDAIISARDPQTNAEREQVYGLPLALDTLALYYNRDLLNLGGVPEPPRTWTEFQAVVKKLTRLDSEGKILQSGAALGTATNVDRAADLLALLMLQNGAVMIDEASSQAVFDRVPANLKDRPTAPGEEAIVFYTDFANSTKEVYTWAQDLPPALEAFASGRTAMMFGYAYHLPFIQARAPRMNLGLAPVPQIEGNPEVNLANYWVEAVPKKSKNSQWAWDFIQFATAQKQVGAYLAAAKRPTALRPLVAGQLEDPDIGTFAAQVLTAKSWYHGINAAAAEQALREAIEATLAGAPIREVLRNAAIKITQTLR